jgi:TolB-like protein/DNA-binding winged helix-turn-helix (wHTH) protein/Tfp pilus assembly protein PilF
MQVLAVPETAAFGPFVLDCAARALFAGGERLTLSSRAFDILALLVAERDRVVSKDEILTKVWRGVAVEENNLAVQMSSLRRVLSEHADGQTVILTVPGQGYRFVARLEAALPLPPPVEDRVVPQALPGPVAAGPASHVAPRAPAKWILGAAVGSICAALLFVAWQSLRPAAAPRLSIAVLPFRNLSDDPKQDYLADAISDDLTTDLSHLPGSVVIARESSDVYKGRAVPAEQIGRALNVRYLLEGSLRGVDGIFHVNAQLIDASNGSHLWAKAFDVPRSQLSDAQAAIVRNIASALDVQLVAIESERSKRERQDNPDAFDLYLQARSLQDTAQSLDQLKNAQELYERTLNLQATNVDAMADLALLLLQKSREHDDPDESADLARSRELISRVLTIEPHNVKALTAKGLEQNIEGKLSESEASLRAALDLEPNNLLALAHLARAEWRLGKPIAASEIYSRLLLLDPQGPDSRTRLSSLGMAYFMEGRFQDSVEMLLRSLAEDASESSAGVDRIEFSNMFLIAAYDRAGSKDLAQKLYQKYNRHWPHRSIWRLSSYFSKAQVNFPGFVALTEGLQDAGMPQYERPPSAPSGTTFSEQDNDFATPPATPKGVREIAVADLREELMQPSKPIILDVGIGAATVAGSIWIRFPENKVGGLDDWLAQIPRAKTIIIVGDGYYGEGAYAAATRAVKADRATVELLTGGEEALAAAKFPTVDRRSP